MFESHVTKVCISKFKMTFKRVKSVLNKLKELLKNLKILKLINFFTSNYIELKIYKGRLVIN